MQFSVEFMYRTYFIISVPVTLAVQSYENYVLILLNSGSGNSLQKTWYNASDQHFATGYKKKRFELLHTVENYRSSLIDEWSLNPPNELILEFLNDFGDVLLSLEFSSSGSETFSFNWHQVSNIIHSSLHFDTSQVDFYISGLFEAVLKEQVTSFAWYGITNSTNDGFGGKFLLTKNYDSPHALQLDLTTKYGGYVGCYQYVSGTTEAKAQMAKNLCFQSCVSSNSEAVLFGFPHSNCACGSLSGRVIKNEDQCAECDDDPSYYCGIVGGLYAVYNTNGSSSQLMTGWDPRKTLVEGLEETIMFQINESTRVVKIFESNNESDTIYVTGFQLLSTSAVRIEYTFHYATQATNHSFRTIDFFKSGTYETPVSDQIYNITVIPATGIEIRFEGDLSLLAGTGRAAIMELYGFAGSDFIEAPWLTIDGLWPIEETTTVKHSTETLDSSTMSHPSTTDHVTTVSVLGISTDLSPSTSDSSSSSYSSTTTSVHLSSTMAVKESADSTYISSATATSDNVTSSIAVETIASTTAAVQSAPQISEAPECSTCSCHVNVNLDIEVPPEIQEKMERVKKNLTIPKNTLSSYLRTKTSAPDDRPSSKSLGSLGIIAIVFASMVIISIDVLNYYTYLKTFINRIRHFWSLRIK